jgi:hypothetical protein
MVMDLDKTPGRLGEDPVREGAAAQDVFAQRSVTGISRRVLRTWSFLGERLDCSAKVGDRHGHRVGRVSDAIDRVAGNET